MPVVKFAARFLIGALTGIAAVALVCVLLLAWRLSRGPVALDFLTPLIQRALVQDANGYRVELGSTVLDFSDWAAFLPVAARDVHLLDRDGREIVAVPRLFLRLGVRGLMRGEVVPTAVEFATPRLNLVRRADGSIGFAGQPEQGAHLSADQLLRVLARSQGRVGGLRRLSIRDAEITFEDQKAGCTWLMSGASADFAYRDVLTVGFNIPIRSSKFATRVSGSGTYAVKTDRGMLRAGFAGLDPSGLPGDYPFAGILHDLHLPLTAEFLLDFTGKDGPVALHTVLSAGAGQIVVPETYAGPVHLDGIDLRARWDFRARMATIHELLLGRGTLKIASRGRLDFGPSGNRPAIVLNGEAQDLSLPALLALWPPNVGAGGRHWVQENMRAAVASKVNFHLNLDREIWTGAAPASDAVDVGFDLTGATAHYLGDLPLLTGASGHGQLSATALRIAIDRGVIDVPKAGRLTVHDGVLNIEPLEHPDAQLDIRFGVTGPAQAVMGLLDQPPLGYASEFGIAPGDVSGAADGTAHLGFPTRKNLRLKDVGFDGQFRLRGFGIKKAVAGLPLTGADLEIAVDRKAIVGKGTGKLGGTPAKLKWTQQLGENAVPTRFGVQTVLSEEAQAKLGLHLAPYIRGPVGIDADLQGKGDEIEAGTVKADLGTAEMALDWARWRKPAGEPATASASFRHVGTKLKISDLTVVAAGLRGHADVTFAPGGGLEILNLTQLVVGSAVDLAGSLRRERERWVIDVHGQALEATDLFREWLKNDSGKPLPAFRLEQAHLARLQLTPTATLAPFSATGAGDGKRIERLEISGVIPQGGTMTIRLQPADLGVRRLNLVAPDGGFVLGMLGITENVHGGELSVSGTLTGGEGAAPTLIKGQADLRNFQVRRAPFLAKTLTLASLTGLRDVLQGQGLSFDRLELPFEMRGSVIEIEDARAVGSSLGITAHGSIDRRAKTLDLEGTVAPIYTLNSLLGHVPVLGDLLLRGKEGLIALRYSAKGPMSDPKVSVNPLSVLTPGFLRGIFDLMPHTGKSRRPRRDGLLSQEAPAPAAATP